MTTLLDLLAGDRPLTVPEVLGPGSEDTKLR